MGKEWIKLKETGQLYLDKILVTFDIPILFVCEDYEKRKYLCLNIDEESGKTVIAETNNKYLIAMLKNEITMKCVFRNAINQKIIVAEYNSKEKIITNIENSKIISSNMLPKENEYFELTNEVIKQYILHLENQKIKIQKGFFLEKLLSIPENKDVSKFNAKYSTANIYTCEHIIITEIIKNKYLYNIKNQYNMIA